VVNESRAAQRDGFVAGLRGIFSSAVAALYTNAARIVLACLRSSGGTRSYVSWFEWWVRVQYSSGSWMNWKAGRPTASNETWSVPPVLRAVIVSAPRSANGVSHLRKIGRAASLPCR
jgi:hypothetical protein